MGKIFFGPLPWLACFLQGDALKRCLDNDGPPQNLKLSLMMHNWGSHRLVTYVAAILLQDYMKYDVEIVEATWGSYEDPERLAKNDVDANFEQWVGTAQMEANIKKWVKAGSAMSAGVHQVPARSGLYVPTYLTSGGDNFYRYTNLNYATFGTMNLTEGEEEGDKSGMCNCSQYIWRPPICKSVTCEMQILKGPLLEDQGLVEQHVADNNLPIQIVYLSKATQSRMIWEAYLEKKPIIIYSYEPRPHILGIAPETFVQVRLPPTANCYKKTNNNLDLNLGVDCDVGSSELRKLVSPRYALAEDAFSFAKKFSLTPNHYKTLFEMRYLTKNDDDPDFLAACTFLRENAVSWKPWVTYTLRVARNLDYFTHECVAICYWQVALASALSALMLFYHISYKENPMTVETMLLACEKADVDDKLVSQTKRTPTVESSFHTGTSSRAVASFSLWKRVMRQARRRLSLSLYGRAVLRFFVGRFSSDNARVKIALVNGELAFTSHRRSAENFVKSAGNSNLVLPVKCGTPMRGLMVTKWDLLFYLLGTTIKDVICVSFIVGLFGSSWGTMCHMIVENRRANLDIFPEGLKQWKSSGEVLLSLTNGFVFLPVFLLTNQVGIETNRWLAYINISYNVQGKVEDLALLMSGAVEGVNHEDTKILLRQELFTAYRYLNAVHYLSYYGLDSRIGSSPDEALSALIECGLLYNDEGEMLLLSSGKIKQVILSWLACLWNEMQQKGAVDKSNTNMFMEKLMDLRGASVVYNEAAPNLTKVMVNLATILLVVFMTIAYPWTLQVDGRCFQPWAFGSVLLLTFCYIGLLKLLKTLDRSPFTADGDCINVDNILCEVERMCFQSMRARFIVECDTSLHIHQSGQGPSPENSSISARKSFSFGELASTRQQQTDDNLYVV